MAVSKSVIQRLDRLEIPFPVLARVFLGVYFIQAAAVKIGDPSAFLKGIHLYNALPEEPALLLNATAIILPWIELACGVALTLGVAVRGAAVNLAIMLAIFTPAILSHALDIRAEKGTPFFKIAFDCGCGTGIEITWIKLCKNGGLFMLAVYAVLTSSRRLCLSAWFNRK